MTTKADTTDCLNRFFDMIQTQFNIKIKIIRSEYQTLVWNFLATDWLNFYKLFGCLQQTVWPYSQQQNDIAKRKHRYLLEIACCIEVIVSGASVLLGWLHSHHYLYCQHDPIIKPSNKSPYEVLFQKIPSFDRIRNFSCLCFMTNVMPSRGKFDPRVKPCVLSDTLMAKMLQSLWL